MDEVEFIDLCSVSQNKNKTHVEGKESTKQESQGKTKHDTTDRMEDELRTKKSKSTTKNGEVETAMMCWEATNNFPKEEPHKEPEKVVKKPVKKTEKPKHEEEHVEPTLNTGNQPKISMKEFSWEREDNRSTLESEELEQQQLVYITNLKNGLRKDSMKLYDAQGPNEKKPAAKNLNHVYELYEESASDNDHIEDSLKGKNKKNLKEEDYTNMDEKKEGK